MIALHSSSKASLYGQIYFSRQSDQREDDSVHCWVSHTLLCEAKEGEMKYLSRKSQLLEILLNSGKQKEKGAQMKSDMKIKSEAAEGASAVVILISSFFAHSRL